VHALVQGFSVSRRPSHRLNAEPMQLVNGIRRILPEAGVLHHTAALRLALPGSHTGRRCTLSSSIRVVICGPHNHGCPRVRPCRRCRGCGRSFVDDEEDLAATACDEMFED